MALAYTTENLIQLEFIHHAFLFLLQFTNYHYHQQNITTTLYYKTQKYKQTI